MDYSSLAATALRQIADKGRNVTLRRDAAGTYNPASDTFTAGDEDNETVKAVITDYHDRQIDGEIIMRGDRRAIIAASGLTAPDKGDVIVDGSDQYRIINIETVKPGDTALLYKLQVRK